MFDLTVLFCAETEVITNNGKVLIKPFMIKQLPQVIAVIDELVSDNTEQIIIAMIALIELASDKTDCWIAELGIDGITVLFEQIKAINTELFKETAGETNSSVDSRDWAFFLQKLRTNGHSEPQNYTLAQAKAYLHAIELMELDWQKSIALAVRMGAWADGNHWQDFMELE